MKMKILRGGKKTGKMPAIPPPPGEKVSDQETQPIEVTHLQAQLILLLLGNVNCGTAKVEVLEQATDLRRKLEQLERP